MEAQNVGKLIGEYVNMLEQAPGCRKLVDDYLGWLSQGFSVESLGRECLITTPFLSPDGDQIQIRTFLRNGDAFLSDDGYAYDFLYMAGIDLDGRSQTRKLQFATILSANNILFDDGEMITKVAQEEGLGPALHRLIRAIQSCQHLIYTTKQTGVRTFREQVAELLAERNVNFKMDPSLPGNATAEHRFDFMIAKNPDIPMVIRALSTANALYARRLAKDLTWAFMDIRQAKVPFQGVALLDDSENVWDGEPYTILKAYSDQVVFWRDRQEFLSLVA